MASYGELQSAEEAGRRWAEQGLHLVAAFYDLH